MPITITPVTVPELTTETLDGTGVFDVLMRANKAHLEAEFTKNRIKGPEYATVYLGALETVLSTSVSFLMNKDKLTLESQLIEQQILLAQVEVTKANAEVLQIQAQTRLVDAQVQESAAQLAILQEQLLKIPAETALLNAQASLADRQKNNLVLEGDNIPKQGQLIDKQNLLIDEQILDLKQKVINAVTENTVLVATECKLNAEFDLLVASKLKADQEAALLLQKVATEKAQTTELGVDDNSVVGRQKGLFQAQTDGFKRDAEQKATKIMVDTWQTRRMTNEAEDANTDNNLDDHAVGGAVAKLMLGIGVVR